MTSTTDVKGCTVSMQETGPNSNLVTGLDVQPIPFVIAKEVLERKHYLHSFPGGTQMAFGVFAENQLSGAITFGAGPFQAYRLVDRACRGDCITLTRFWLDSTLPRNSASRVIGYVIRSLRQHTNLKFLVTYADPTEGHVGTIYQATGWLYTGMSISSSMYDLGDGILYHSRTLGGIYGTRSKKYFRSNGINVTLVPQPDKHRYIYFLDRSWIKRLNVTVLPYPKKGS